jgi:hypothetical protein
MRDGKVETLEEFTELRVDNRGVLDKQLVLALYECRVGTGYIRKILHLIDRFGNTKGVQISWIKSLQRCIWGGQISGMADRTPELNNRSGGNMHLDLVIRAQAPTFALPN